MKKTLIAVALLVVGLYTVPTNALNMTEACRSHYIYNELYQTYDREDVLEHFGSVWAKDETVVQAFEACQRHVNGNVLDL